MQKQVGIWIFLVVAICAQTLWAQESRPLAFQHTAKGLVLTSLAETNPGGWRIERSTNLVDWSVWWTNRPPLPCLATDQVSQATAFYRATWFAPPVITQGPTNCTVQGVVSKRIVAQSVAAEGPGPLTYEWRDTGGQILKTGQTVTFQANHIGGVGTYRLIVRGLGGIASTNFTVTIKN